MEIIRGTPQNVVKSLNESGFKELYIDGGVTIQNFLQEDLIDEMIITTIPILLGGGTRLFGDLAEPIHFKHIKTEVLLNAMSV